MAGFSNTGWSMTYNDQDLLLAFRGQNNDVVFNIGPVGQFLGKTSGTIISVTNFNINIVKAQNGGSLAGVQVVLAANNRTSLNTIVYLTDADAAGGAMPATVATLGSQANLVDKIGTVSKNYGASGTNYNAAPHSSEGSYTQIIPAGTLPAKWNGLTAFNIETDTTGVLPFIQFQGYATPVKLGAFSFDASGNLSFVAGANALIITAPSIITPPANVTFVDGQTVNFSVVATGSSLTYQWSVDGMIDPEATNSTYSFTAKADLHDGVLVTVTVGNQLATYTASARMNLPAVPPQMPQIGAITCVNGTNCFSFPTENNVTYTVLYSSTLSAPLSDWFVLGTSVGDGNPKIVTDAVKSASTRFYAIKANR